jgi:RNA polymerase sigma-70 factor (ECF subfamily)
MHHVMGLTAKEISEELGVPQETVRSRLRLAKKRLLRLEHATDSGGSAA